MKDSTALPMRKPGTVDRPRLARTIRLWSIFGVIVSLAASFVLEGAVTMAVLAVSFFFAYMFATQWRERLAEPTL